MALTEIVAKLKAFANSMKLAPVGDAMGFDESDAVWLDAAITHLDPYTQPITPERLEAAGFRLDTYNIWRRTVESKDGRFHLSWKVRGGVERFYVLIGAASFVLPGVRSMGHVLELIEMLEGGDHAASDC